jgi:hypothetical protein
MSNTYDTTVCPICQDNIELCDKAYLNCGHCFHLKCRNTALTTKAECPLCRQNVKNVDIILESKEPYNVTPYHPDDEFYWDDASDEENTEDTEYGIEENIDEENTDEYDQDEYEPTEEEQAEISLTQSTDLISDSTLIFSEKLKYFRKTRIPKINIEFILFDKKGHLISTEKLNTIILDRNQPVEYVKNLYNLYKNNYDKMPIELDLYKARIDKILLYNRALDTGEKLEEQPLLYTIIESKDPGTGSITYGQLATGIEEIRIVEEDSELLTGVYYRGEYENIPVYEVVFQSTQITED